MFLTFHMKQKNNYQRDWSKLMAHVPKADIRCLLSINMFSQDSDATDRLN